MTDTPAAPTIADIRAAADRLAGHARLTPLLEAPLLSRAAGRRVLVKAECLQRTGSFKFRGAWSHLSALDGETLARGVLAFSSGNHAQGVAAAAAEHGAPAAIIMPADAPRLKIENTKALGAEVVTYDRVAGESREELGAKLQAERGMRLVRPYDDALVIAGQGTVGLEIIEQASAMGVEGAELFCCCGGGGLSSGVALALEERRAQTGAPWRLHPVEPQDFDDWRRSLEADARQVNSATSGSICDAILTPSPGDITWPIGRRLFGAGVAVSDRDARRAMAAAFRHLKIVLEPGGAVALAAALFHADAAEPGAPVVAIASGGNVDLADYSAWIAEWSDPDAWSPEGLPL